MIELALAAVVLLALVAIAAILFQSERQAKHTAHLVAHIAQLQASHAHERWEHSTRLQAPQVAAAGAIPPPATAMPDPSELLATLGVLQPSVPDPDTAPVDGDDEWDDQSHLVGTGPAMPTPSSSEIA